MLNVTGASISFNTKDALVQSANIQLVNFKEPLLNKELQVFYELNGTSILLGTLLTTTPTEEINKTHKTQSVDCYSTLLLLNKYKLEQRYTCKLGTQVTNEIIRLLQPLNLKYTLEVDLSDKATSADIDFEIGTTYLEVINTLLSIINYSSLYPLPNGNYKANPYNEAGPQAITLNEDDKDNVIIPKVNLTNDFYTADNVYIRYVDSPAGHLVAKYENNNPDSIISTVNAPVSHNVAEVRDVSDLETLYEIAKRECLEATGRIISGKLYTKFIELWYNNIINLKLNGVSGSYKAVGWQIDCQTGAIMQIDIEKVVKL